jgi:hypothetical protein
MGEALTWQIYLALLVARLVAIVGDKLAGEVRS